MESEQGSTRCPLTLTLEIQLGESVPRDHLFVGLDFLYKHIDDVFILPCPVLEGAITRRIIEEIWSRRTNVDVTVSQDWDLEGADRVHLRVTLHSTASTEYMKWTLLGAAWTAQDTRAYNIIGEMIKASHLPTFSTIFPGWESTQLASRPEGVPGLISPEQRRTLAFMMDRENRGTRVTFGSKPFSLTGVDCRGGFVDDDPEHLPAVTVLLLCCSRPLPRTAIVCPKVLVPQWMRLAAQRTPLLDVRAWRHDLDDSAQVVVIPYECAENVRGCAWDRVVYDQSYWLSDIDAGMKAKHVWCVSPMMVSAQELTPQLRVLGFTFQQFLPHLGVIRAVGIRHPKTRRQEFRESLLRVTLPGEVYAKYNTALQRIADSMEFDCEIGHRAVRGLRALCSIGSVSEDALTVTYPKDITTCSMCKMRLETQALLTLCGHWMCYTCAKKVVRSPEITAKKCPTCHHRVSSTTLTQGVPATGTRIICMSVLKLERIVATVLGEKACPTVIISSFEESLRHMHAALLSNKVPTSALLRASDGNAVNDLWSGNVQVLLVHADSRTIHRLGGLDLSVCQRAVLTEPVSKRAREALKLMLSGERSEKGRSIEVEYWYYEATIESDLIADYFYK